MSTRRNDRTFDCPGCGTVVWAHTAEHPQRLYQADEDSLAYCSRSCAEHDEQRQERQYLRRLEQGVRTYGAARYLHLNPLLADDIHRVARRLGLTVPTAA